MTATVKPVPEGFTAVTPHLVVDGAAAAIDFYRCAFGALEVLRMPMPDGRKIMHAEIAIGGARIMLADELPGMGSPSPKALGGSAVTLMLYVEDADTVFDRAVSSGATVTMPLADMFWGDRYGRLVDPFGHHWAIATHIADLTPEEIERAAAAIGGGPSD